MRKDGMMNKVWKKAVVFGLVGAMSLGAFSLSGVAAEQEEGKVLLSEVTHDESNPRVKGWLDLADLVDEAMPSVVSITTKSVQEVMDYFSFFYGGSGAPQTYEVEGGGSGIIITETDDVILVLTNYHVVKDAKQVAVCFIDNNAYKGVVKGYDAEQDVAVLAVNKSSVKDETKEQIKVAKIGSSDDLRVGEQVFLIGNALGYGQSVTTGIVSAKDRQINEQGEAAKEGPVLIQTDAAINPGNSGGAMLNMDGEVVGINQSKISSTVVESVCYAIAIDNVKDVIVDIMNEQTRERVSGTHGALGIMASSVEEREVLYYGIPEGALVVEVTEGSAAEKAGLKQGDVITALDGRTVHTSNDLVDILTYYEPDEVVTLKVSSREGATYEEKEVQVTLQAAKSSTSEEEEKDQKKFDFGDWEEGDDDFFFRGFGEGRDNKEEEEEEDSFGQGSFWGNKD